VKGRAIWWFLKCLVAMTVPCCALVTPQIDTGECQVDSKPSVTKSAIVIEKVKHLRVYGQLEFVPTGDAKRGCHVVYRLFVAKGTSTYSEIYKMNYQTEVGEIAGIDFVGFSPNHVKLAADLWWTAGDGTVHRPLVYDVATGSVLYKPLDEAIQKKIHGCDQVERFAGITDEGLAIFTVPPSIYDDSPECGDKGVWHFNLRTGVVTQVAKISNDKWR